LLESSVIAGGKLIRIGDVLRIETRPVMLEIRCENQQYTRFITFNFKGPYMHGERYVNSVIKSIDVPPGYEVKRPEFLFSFGKRESIPLVLIACVSILIVFMSR
jgi:hypothetical protein